MCGIVGAAAHRNVVPLLLAGLKALEYRGYDSAGLSLQSAGSLTRLRAAGKVRDLEAIHAQSGTQSECGIAHTRWATHGVPSTENAHPHTSNDAISVVHNGIIENHEALRSELLKRGYQFESQTDTEVIAHLIHAYVSEGHDLLEATRIAVSRMHGAYAIAVLARDQPKRVIAARLGSPLVLGLGENENFLASDVQALISETNRFVFLEEGDIAEIKPDQFAVYTLAGEAITRPIKKSSLRADAVQRGEYRHYMLKEIHEQPQAVADTLEGRLAGGKVLSGIFGARAHELLAATKQVQIVACGTSYHAGMVARYWIEQWARVPVSVDIASEFRYRAPVVGAGCLYVSISQSGETMDTLSALRMAKQLGYLGTLAICNVPESSMVRESELCLMTRAGPEIGVASTKAFTTQLTAIALLALELGRLNGMSADKLAALTSELEQLPNQLRSALALEPQVKSLAESFVQKQHALFLGRGVQYPVALEGALKLKEISYIHAEAYPAGELKHGPLALVDKDMPVIAVAPNDVLLEKLKSNMAEVRARGGQLIVFADAKASLGFSSDEVRIINMPEMHELTAPILMTVPLQLLAYHVAVLRGTDVDQPRNLAKSVTVE
jgi:glucosamine--fructose-6-phosphate aminotransferase (isomerizing)